MLMVTGVTADWVCQDIRYGGTKFSRRINTAVGNPVRSVSSRKSGTALLNILGKLVRRTEYPRKSGMY